jgi:hypothetical protein
MKVRAQILTFLFLTTSIPANFGQPDTSAERAADRTSILRSMERISKAYVARDPEPFDQILLPDFVLIREKPLFNARDQLSAMMRADSVIVRAGKRPEFTTLSYENVNPQFFFYGPTAVVSVAKNNYWQYRGTKCLTRTQATELWVEIEGSWQAAASHATNFHCNDKPYYPVHAAVAAIPGALRPRSAADPAVEQQVREVINELVRARASGEETFKAALGRAVAGGYIFTALDGSVTRELSVLSGLPASTPTRSSGIRGNEDVLAVYGKAAVFTFKIRSRSATVRELPQLASVFLAQQDGRWMIVAAHLTRYTID